VTSIRQLRANQENARHSTGPQSAEGRARSSRNAFRHGLSTPVWANRTLGAEAEALARQLAGPGASPARLRAARPVAEADIDLLRVRRLRNDFLERAFWHPGYLSERGALNTTRNVIELQTRMNAAREERLVRAETDEDFEAIEWASEDDMLDWTAEDSDVPLPPIPRTPKAAEKIAAALVDFSHQVAAFDRYETRALSRRKFAIRAFDSVVEEEEARARNPEPDKAHSVI
jgi:hypothetical protein